MIWVGVTSTAMPTPAGWQASFFVWLQHIGRVMTGAFSWLPNWAAILVLVMLIGGLAFRALKQVGTRPGREVAVLNEREAPTDEARHNEAMKEKISE